MTFYTKGKVLIQGKAAQEVAGWIDPSREADGQEPFASAVAKHPVPFPECWAGIDETGKGDYFGPLIVVAAAVRRTDLPLLAELGVADSKKVSDHRVLDLSPQLKAICRFRKVVIGPERYNALYAKIGNLNRLLAWGHARALEDLLEPCPDVDYALGDQFAPDPKLVESRLGPRGRAIRFAQRPRAEEDPAVAVASILARAELLWQMRRLERETGLKLPRGSGAPVLSAAARIVETVGAEMLPRVAKLHFAITDQVGGRR